MLIEAVAETNGHCLQLDVKVVIQCDVIEINQLFYMSE
jgi:hypothetical protein